MSQFPKVLGQINDFQNWYPVKANVYTKYFQETRSKYMSEQIEVLKNAYKIEESSKKDALLAIVADKYCRIIIDATKDKPKSAMELAYETKIPISTIYRRLQTLHDSSLLHTSGMISEDGKKLFLYKSKVKGIHSTFEDGNVDIKLILNR